MVPPRILSAVGDKAYLLFHVTAGEIVTIQVGATKGKALAALTFTSTGLTKESSAEAAEAMRRVLRAIE